MVIQLAHCLVSSAQSDPSLVMALPAMICRYKQFGHCLMVTIVVDPQKGSEEMWCFFFGNQREMWGISAPWKCGSHQRAMAKTRPSTLALECATHTCSTCHKISTTKSGWLKNGAQAHTFAWFCRWVWSAPRFPFQPRIGRKQIEGHSSSWDSENSWTPKWHPKHSLALPNLA